jgi:concanavalin A-like lectin/glucanase superfamily protein
MKKFLVSSFLFLVIAINAAQAATRLGLHVTSEELAILQQRATKGPYKSTGDVSTNSPGDWDRVVSKKNTFNSNPSAETWNGKTTSGCWVNTPGANGFLPSRTKGENIEAAGLYSLVMNDSGTRTNVINELITQAGVSGVQWNDGVKWIASTPCADGDDASFDITNWLTKLLFAYDYVRTSMTSGQQSTMNAWFLAAANLWEAATDHIIEVRFPNRDSGDYTTLGVPTTCDFTTVKYYGDPTPVCMWWMEAWNNRNSTHERLVALVGIMQGNSTLIAKAKRYFKEVLTYVVWPDNTIKEYDRWEDTNPALGWTYAGLFIGALSTMADAFARTGDLELYNYSTSSGISAHGTNGGPKSLGAMIHLFQRHVNHDITRYGTATAGNNGNAAYIVDSLDGVSGEQYGDDHYFAQANVYYQNAFDKTIYMRTASGAPAYVAAGSYNTGGWTGYTGEWGVYAAPMFQFAQMEGVVNPFSLGPAASVTWSNDRGGSGTASGTATWTAAGIPLLAGVNNITVTANDGAGNISTDQIAVTYVPTFPGNSLAGAWGFEEGSGSNAVDSSGNSNSGGLINAPTRTTGRYGQGLQFNGTNQYVTVADANSLDFTQSFTLSAWVNPAQVHTDFRPVIVKNYVYELYASVSGYCGDGAPLVNFNTNGILGPSYYACYPTPLPIGQPSHLAATYDGSNLKLYINGALVATTPASGYLEPSTGTLDLGHSQYGEFFDGMIDEARVYNWALPLTAGGNTTPGAPCAAQDQLNTPSIVGSMNCAVIPLAPPLPMKFGSSSVVKFGSNAIFRAGQVP